MFNLHYRLERNAIGFVLAIIVVRRIGGLRGDRAVVHHLRDRRKRAGDAGLHAARNRRRPYLHSRRLLRLSSQMIRTLRDEVGAIWAVFARRRIPIRSSDAVGVETNRSGHCASQRAIFRRMARRASEQSARRGAEIGNAPLFVALAANRRATTSTRHLAALREVGVPYTDEMVANAAADASDRRGPIGLSGGGGGEVWRGDERESLRRRTRRLTETRCARWRICKFWAG